MPAPPYYPSFGKSSADMKAEVGGGGDFAQPLDAALRGIHEGMDRRAVDPQRAFSPTPSSAKVNTFAPSSPTWVERPGPRVERCPSKMGMYERAMADTRPASIAFPLVENNVGIEPRLLSKSLIGSTMSATAFFTADRRIPQLLSVWGGGPGERQLLFNVKRRGKDWYSFEGLSAGIKGKPLECEKGQIKDTDSPKIIDEKLHLIFPVVIPSVVKHGDAVPPGLEAKRKVRCSFAFKGRLLDETKPVGPQCLAGSFNSNF